MSSFLDSIGATPRVRASFQPFAAQGFTLARISRVDRGAYKILDETGEELSAEPTGALLHRASAPSELPAVGDWAAVRVFQDFAVLHAVLPRSTAIGRRAAGKREERQILAANAGIVLLVCGLDTDLNARRLERYLVLVEESGARPVIVLNKADLCRDIAAAADEAARIAPHAPVVVAQAGAPSGIAAVAGQIHPGETAVLLGPSGAGKSTLINRLLESPRQHTGEVRPHDRRGRHTTTSRQLIPLPQGGVVIDTPGLRELQLWVGVDSVRRTFDDVAQAAAFCRFRDCTHSGEPGCAVAAALEDGSLAPDRWDSYLKLIRELRRHEVAADPLAALRNKKHVKQIHKAMRNIGRGQ